MTSRAPHTSFSANWTLLEHIGIISRHAVGLSGTPPQKTPTRPPYHMRASRITCGSCMHVKTQCTTSQMCNGCAFTASSTITKVRQPYGDHPATRHTCTKHTRKKCNKPSTPKTWAAGQPYYKHGCHTSRPKHTHHPHATCNLPHKPPAHMSFPRKNADTCPCTHILDGLLCRKTNNCHYTTITKTHDHNRRVHRGFHFQ